MNTTVKNLTVTHHDPMLASARSTFVEMAGKLPFEKKRTRELEIDQETYTRQIIEKCSSNCGSYVAKYPEDIVGGVSYEKFETDKNQTVLRVHGEWIQRNRTDIRRSIYQKISKDFPGAYLMVIYPAQNRTARNEVANFSFAKTINTRRIFYFSRILSRQSSTEEIYESAVQLHTLQTPESDLSGFKFPSSVLDSEVDLLDSGNGPETIQATTREIPTATERGNIVQIRGLIDPGKIRVSHFLIRLKTNIREKHYSSLEFTLNQENSNFRRVLEKSNYILRNKRIGWMGKFLSSR